MLNLSPLELKGVRFVCARSSPRECVQQRSTCFTGSAFGVVAEASVLYKLFVSLLKGAQIGVEIHGHYCGK